MDALNLNTGSVSGQQSLDRAKQLAMRVASGEADQAEQSTVGDEFEALLGTMLVKELRKSLPNGFFGGGTGSDIMEGWLDEHVGRSISDGWQLDIAGMVRVNMEQSSDVEASDVQANAKPVRSDEGGAA